MKINAFSFNPFGEMTYVVWDDKSREAAIVDPGMLTDREKATLDNFISKNSLKVKYLLNTHMHLDHVFGNSHIERTYGVKAHASADDAFLGGSVREQAMMFGLPAEAENAEVGIDLKDGDRITIGQEDLEVITTPGHSPGSICFYCPTSNFVLTGDTLFRRGIGRTDLAGGDSAAITDSISKKLYSLPDDTLVVPGHGPTTTIGEERNGNPYV